MPLAVKSRASKGTPVRSAKSKLLTKKKLVTKKVKTPQKTQQRKTVHASKKRKVLQDEEEDFEDYEGDEDFDPEHFEGFSKADLAKLNHIPDGDDDSEEDELRAALAQYAKEQGLGKDEEDDESEDEFGGEFEDEEGEGEAFGEAFDEELAGLDDEDPFGEGDDDDDDEDKFAELYQEASDDEEDIKPTKKTTTKKGTKKEETLKRKRSNRLEDVEDDFESDEEEGTGIWDADDVNLDDDEDYDLLPTDILQQLKNKPKSVTSDLKSTQKKKAQRPRDVRKLQDGLEVRTTDSLLYSLMRRPQRGATKPNAGKVPATRGFVSRGLPAVRFTSK